MSDVNAVTAGSAGTSVAKIPLYRLRVYNPSQLSDEEITVLFAVREELLQRILSDVSAELPSSRPQHHLLVGQRGMGKTTLLLRIAAELRASPLRDRFIPLTFAEEQYSIDRLSQFWLNCLDSLADSCDREGRNDQAQTIDRMVSGITDTLSSSPKDDTAAARAAQVAFLEASAMIGRRPVLLVDNLQLVFERTAGQQHELRAALTDAMAPILVAAAPQLPQQISDYSYALYDHFKIHHLRALSLNEMQQLLLRLADRTDRPSIRRHVLEHPGRLRALHQLTGGNPRTTVLLFHLFAEDCSPSVADDLEKLLDDVTVLYKARFEELSDQQQVIVSRLAEHWDPADSRTLTENTHLEPGQVSSQLDRLVKAGVVEEVAMFATKRAGYQLAERFFNIWFLMRHASRRLKQPVRFLSKFLETLYEPGEREQFARTWSNSSRLNASSLLFSRALADSISEASIRGDLVRHTELEALNRLREDASRQVEKLFEFDKIESVVLEFDDLRSRLSTKYGVESARRILGSLDLFLNERRTLLANAPMPSPEQIQAVLEQVLTGESRLSAEFGDKAVAWLANRLTRGQLCHPDAADDWERTLAAADDEPTARLVVDNMPSWLAKKVKPEICERVARLLAESQKQTSVGWYNTGWSLHVKLGHYSEAESAYRRAIWLDPKDGTPWNGLGNLLQDHLSRYTEAETAYRRAIELDPKNGWPWNGLGNLLKNHLLRYTEAESAYRRAIELDPKDGTPWIGLGNLYCDYLGRFADAVDAYAKAEGFPECRTISRHNLVFLYRDFLGDFVAARRAFASIEQDSLPELVATRELHQTLFAAHEQNLGMAAAHLDTALDLIPHGLPPMTVDDWSRAAAVLLDLGHGEWLQQVLKRRGHHQTLRPFFEAIRAHTIGDRQALLNVAVEIRPSADWLFEQVQHRRRSRHQTGIQQTVAPAAPRSARRRG